MSTKTIVLLVTVGICAVIVSTNGTRHSDCSLPLDTGLCRARFSRWGFDTAKNKCKEFTWGGCKGNANNFKTEKECNAMCADVSERKIEPEEATREFEIVPGSCSCKCPKCDVIPKIEQTGRGFPDYSGSFNLGI